MNVEPDAVAVGEDLSVVGAVRHAKRLERGKFVWRRTQGGAAARLSAAQLAMLIEGLGWRQAIVYDEVLTPTLA